MDTKMDNGHAKQDCNFSPDLRLILGNMHTVIANTHDLLITVTEAQKSMAVSASSMARTNDAAEKRYVKMENRLQEVNDERAGKNQMPISSHIIILATTLIITLLVVTYVTRQSVEGSINSLKISQGQ